jgi:hypothetical protein
MSLLDLATKEVPKRSSNDAHQTMRVMTGVTTRVTTSALPSPPADPSNITELNPQMQAAPAPGGMSVN